MGSEDIALPEAGFGTIDTNTWTITPEATTTVMGTGMFTPEEWQNTISMGSVAPREIDHLPKKDQEVLSDMRARFTHDQLLQALYWVEDFMARSLINFFVIGPTADAVKGQQPLTGDAVFIGVRRLEWEGEPRIDEHTPAIPSGGRRIVDTLAPYAEDEGDIVYYYANNDVPVILFVLEDEPTITSLDQVQYHREFFKLPNPLRQFKEQYDILWS